MLLNSSHDIRFVKHRLNRDCIRNVSSDPRVKFRMLNIRSKTTSARCRGKGNRKCGIIYIIKNKRILRFRQSVRFDTLLAGVSELLLRVCLFDDVAEQKCESVSKKVRKSVCFSFSGRTHSLTHSGSGTYYCGLTV